MADSVDPHLHQTSPDLAIKSFEEGLPLHPDDLEITSINVGRAESLEHGARQYATGILKQPVAGPVRISAERVADDAICNLEHHGGPDQAVYVYSEEDYAWWSSELGQDCKPGLFGENLTIRGLPTDIAVGDRLLVGEVLLEATSPRIPCSTLAARMQDSNFGLAFRRARRPGVYFRVLNPGSVATGDRPTYLSVPDSPVSVLDLFDVAFEPRPDPDALRRYLEAPVAIRIRRMLETRLGAAGGA